MPRDPSDKPALFAALTELAEQDPLINLRQDDTRQELFLSLYGEVQREIVAETLAADHGVEVEFRSVTPLCVERPRRAASAIETIPRHRSSSRPFLATVGLTVAPLPPDSGVTFTLDVKVGEIPMHVFDTVDAFREVMARTVRDTLHQGLHGWNVTDCAVTMTRSDYQAPPRRWPGTTLSDFRLLTPLVVMAALRRAGTTVCEPVLDVHLEFPADVLGDVIATLIKVEAIPGTPAVSGRVGTLDAEVRAARLHDLQSRLPDLTRGEGVLESAFGGYRARRRGAAGASAHRPEPAGPGRLPPPPQGCDLARARARPTEVALTGRTREQRDRVLVVSRSRATRVDRGWGRTPWRCDRWRPTTWWWARARWAWRSPTP